MQRPRNSRCPCGSRQKYKHCCGALSGHLLRPSDDELLSIAIVSDNEGLAAGEEPKQRSFQNILRMFSKLGLDGVLITGDNAPEIVRRIHAANNRLFRPIDQSVGGVHLGFFMFRDLFSRFRVPIAFGTPVIDMMQLLDFSDDQKRWMALDSNVMERFTDQAFDLFDFGYGQMEFGHDRPVSDLSREFIFRSHIHLESAAATVTSGSDYRGSLQSALLGTELALKAGLSVRAYAADELKREFSHNLKKAARHLGSLVTSFDVDRTLRALDSFPDFAESRYQGSQPNRREMGEILMKSQYIASEVTRTFTDRNIRRSHIKRSARSYPM